MILYTDIDAYCCEVISARIADGSLPPGEVWCRDVTTLTDDELRAFDQVHLFCGIGGSPLGLKMAGWPSDAPIVTGGFPCQDVSDAGLRAGITAPRSGLFREVVRPFAWHHGPTGSWRTWQRCFDGEWELYSESWPPSGVTRSGIAYRRAMLVPHTDAREYGLWPTPHAGMAIDAKFTVAQLIKRKRRNQRDGFQTGPGSGSLTDAVLDELGGFPTPQFVEWLMGFPVGWTNSKPSATRKSRSASKSSPAA